MKKKILLAGFLIILSIISMGVLNVSASELISEGKCGTNLIWTLDLNGTLTITGSGAMDKYTYDKYYSDIKKVIISDSILNIGNYAFSGYPNLTSVSIGNDVTSIGDYAFNYCTNLKYVTIGNSVMSVGKSAFQGCGSLTSVTFSNSVTDIGDYAFSYCSGIIDVKMSDILSLYEDGKLVEIYSTAYKGEEILFNVTQSYNEAKVMVWNNLTSLKPVCDFEIVK